VSVSLVELARGKRCCDGCGPETDEDLDVGVESEMASWGA